jgi:hypothetical protein
VAASAIAGCSSTKVGTLMIFDNVAGSPQTVHWNRQASNVTEDPGECMVLRIAIRSSNIDLYQIFVGPDLFYDYALVHRRGLLQAGLASPKYRTMCSGESLEMFRGPR